MADQQEKEAPVKAATEKAEAKAPAVKAAPSGAETAKAAGPTTYAYVGPARPFGVPIMPHAILRGEPVAVIPALGPQLEEHPALRRLFVPVADLARARQELASPGSGLGIIYRDIQLASAKARKA
ncbi:MAG: 50S ribosomal protein L37 [Desulfovibrio sp.]|nr:50S ribosomal protein L37 [Desulfovibrio sp.]